MSFSKRVRDILNNSMNEEPPRNLWQPDDDDNQVSVGADPNQASQTIISSQTIDLPDNPPITWTAHEYVHSDRNVWWFVGFAVVVVGLIAVDVFLLKSWTFSALVVVMAISLIVYIRRPPRQLTYALSPTEGLYVGERLYSFGEFKAFGLIQDGEHHSIMLLPRRRFSPGVSVYFPEESGEQIVDILGQQLPMENLKLDVVDVIVRKLRL